MAIYKNSSGTPTLIAGTDVASTPAPSTGDTLIWDGTKWVPDGDTFVPVPTVAALTPTTGTVTIDLAGADYRTHDLSGNPDYSATSNRVAGRSVVVRVNPGGSARTPTWNASWKWIGTKPTSLTANKYGLLSLLALGTAETDIIASYAEEA